MYSVGKVNIKFFTNATKLFYIFLIEIWLNLASVLSMIFFAFNSKC